MITLCRLVAGCKLGESSPARSCLARRRPCKLGELKASRRRWRKASELATRELVERTDRGVGNVLDEDRESHGKLLFPMIALGAASALALWAGMRRRASGALLTLFVPTAATPVTHHME